MTTSHYEQSKMNIDQMTREQLQKDLQGKLVLIGLTFVNENGELAEQYQTHGIILEITDDEIMRIIRNDDSVFQMPYSEEAITKAAAGEYREKTTGATVKNPDFIMTWEIIVDEADDLASIKKYGYVPAD